jgi:TRAP-type C4-dicarboxylate transport system permease small subunit
MKEREMTTTRTRKVLTRLAWTILGLAAGWALTSVWVLTLARYVTRYPLLSIPAFMVAVALPTLGLLLGWQHAGKRLQRPPKPRPPRLDPGAERPNRLIRHV